MVRLACDLCPRRGQYRKETLIARFGGDVLMPDVRHLIAERPRRDGPARFHFFRVTSLCVAITSLIFRKDPCKAVECQGNEQHGEQRFHLCVNVPHPLLIRMHKWLSRTKFSRGKPLTFHKSELKKRRFLVRLRRWTRCLDVPMNDLSHPNAR
jgi:hypothetical protein